VLEQEERLRDIDHLLAGVRHGTGGVLVVEGQAGIGKTRLAAEIRERAAAGGAAVYVARGHELEADLPFGVVRQLLDPAVTDRAARSGRAAAVFTAAADDEPVDPVSVVHALFALTVDLAARAPLTLIVDDAHWSDPPSLRWLHYLARRSRDLPVLTVVLSRPDEESRAAGVLSSLPGLGTAHRMHLEPLRLPAVTRLLTDRLGPVDDRFAAACLAATGGNPFLVTELGRQVAARGTRPAADEITELAGPAVRESVLGRLRRAGPVATAVAQAAAVLGERGRLDQLAVLAGVPTAVAAIECDRLRRCGILGPTELSAFVHPLVAAAVRQGIPVATRGVLHGRAARLLAEAGAPDTRVAAQLLATPPMGDAWVVDVLRQAARDALAAGAPEAAASYLCRASVEPPTAALRARVHCEWGQASALFDPRAAIPQFVRAERLAGDDTTRCVAAIGLAKAFAHADQVGDAVRTLAATVPTITDPALRLRLRAERLMWSGWWTGHTEPHERRTELDVLLSQGTGATGRMLRVLHAWDRLVRGAPAGETLALAGQILHETPRWIGGDVDVRCLLGQVFLYCDQPEQAGALFDSGLTEHGWHDSILRTLRAGNAYRCGDLARAEADARAAWQQAPDIPSWSLATLTQVLTARGELTEAAELAARNGLGEGRRDAAMLPDPLAVRGELRLAQGRVDEAVTDLRLAGQALEAHGCANPAWNPWRMSLAVALRTRAPDEARAVAEEAHRRAERFGRPWALGRALRTRGLVTGGPAGLELLAEAVRVLAPSPARFEHAHALVDWGAALRRANHRDAAREPLRAGLDLADRCGAGALSRRARQELTTIGARPRRARLTGPAALTPSEFRVATLAATGMGNLEIADVLLVTRKTVEKHLAASYAKLGIRSRHELPQAFAQE
jgi:DNA-binding CsgD family transcriptional regulator